MNNRQTLLAKRKSHAESSEVLYSETSAHFNDRLDHGSNMSLKKDPSTFKVIRDKSNKRARSRLHLKSQEKKQSDSQKKGMLFRQFIDDEMVGDGKGNW